MTANGSILLTTLALFFAMLVCLLIGHRLGHLAVQKDARFHEGLGAIQAAIFALLGLLLGFSFAGGMSRLDARRLLIVREASAIGTAYLRVDLLPAGDQPAVRELFRSYLAKRLAAYESRDFEMTMRLIVESAKLQHELWTRIVELTRADPTGNVGRVVIPAINEMIDVTTARTVALQSHLPRLIFTLLMTMAMLSALVAGYAMAARPRRSLLHMVLYPATVSLTVYTMMDLDNPRVGLIRLDAAESILKELYDSIR